MARTLSSLSVGTDPATRLSSCSKKLGSTNPTVVAGLIADAGEIFADECFAPPTVAELTIGLATTR